MSFQLFSNPLSSSQTPQPLERQKVLLQLLLTLADHSRVFGVVEWEGVCSQQFLQAPKILFQSFPSSTLFPELSLINCLRERLKEINCPLLTLNLMMWNCERLLIPEDSSLQSPPRAFFFKSWARDLTPCSNNTLFLSLLVFLLTFSSAEEEQKGGKTRQRGFSLARDKLR